MTHIIDHLVVGPFATNVYVFGDPEHGEGAIIDGGGDAEGLLGLAEKHGLKITQILQTHAHVDHVAALPKLHEALGVQIYLHPDDAMLYNAAPQQGMMFGYPVDPLPDAQMTLADGGTVEVAGMEADIIHLPGHSPGGVAFHFKSIDTLFVGDILFAGSIGRVDLPGADPAAMKASLDRLKELPDQTRVLPGHGPETTIGLEKQRNPFLLQDW